MGIDGPIRHSSLMSWQPRRWRRAVEQGQTNAEIAIFMQTDLRGFEWFSTDHKPNAETHTVILLGPWLNLKEPLCFDLSVSSAAVCISQGCGIRSNIILKEDHPDLLDKNFSAVFEDAVVFLLRLGSGQLTVFPIHSRFFCCTAQTTP